MAAHRVKTTPNSPRRSVQVVESVHSADAVRLCIARHMGIALDADEEAELRVMADEFIAHRLCRRHFCQWRGQVLTYQSAVVNKQRMQGPWHRPVSIIHGDRPSLSNVVRSISVGVVIQHRRLTHMRVSGGLHHTPMAADGRGTRATAHWSLGVMPARGQRWR